MDAALLALATSCANSLVSLLTTDAWEQAKRGVRKTFGRADAAEGERAESELTGARREIERALSRDDKETPEELATAWRGKFRRLLLEDPEAADLLKEVLQEWDALTPAGDTNSASIIQNATARESGRVYQQGSGTQMNF